MNISFRNWLVGATIDANTANAVNAAGAIAQFNGDPVGIRQPTGILGFSLGASRRIRSLAVLDCRGGGGTFRIRVRSGGAAGTLLKTWSFGITSNAVSYATSAPYNVYESTATDVTGDYVSIECLGRSNSVYPASSVEYTMIGRIWAGDYVPLDLAEIASYVEVDNTIIEESRTGEEFFTEMRSRRDISSPAVRLYDNLSSASASVDGSYENFNDGMILGSQEVLVYAHSEFEQVFHGQLNGTTLRKLAGPYYQASPFNVGGF